MKFTGFIFLALCFVFVLTLSCLPESRKEERLARTYCGSCHLFPEPALLDKATWSKVLPQMAFRMGVGHFEIMDQVPTGDLPVVMATIPSTPMVTQDQWLLIEKYYTSNAPDSLVVPDREISAPLSGFDVSLSGRFKAPFVTLIKMDTSSGDLYVGTRLSRIYKLDKKLHPIDSLTVSSAPSDIIFDGDQNFVTLMGIMDPNDQARGSLVKSDRALGPAQIILDTLRRPVNLNKTDLNTDGIEDMVVCAFGNYTGSLSVYDMKQSPPARHVLSLKPGARKTVVKDFNRDGLPDIMALMTQGDERLVLYINKGDFVFEEQNIMQFPSVYGSNYFELADFNNDGWDDILYVNGDNGDYSVISKPYHGVRILENDGTNHFAEKWSYFMAGASQAVARDFDGDGDLDIAAIAFFPDFRKHPEQSFIYLENKGGYKFEPQITTEAKKGRWLVMETADFDRDGDTDILVGSANFKGMGFNGKEEWPEGEGTLLVLKNKRR